MVAMKKTPKKRRLLLILSGILLVIGSGLTAFLIWRLAPRYREVDTSVNVKTIHFFGDQKQYVLAPSKVDIIQDHAYTIRFREPREEKESYTIQKGEYLKVDIYDLRTKDLKKKTIDFYQLDMGRAYRPYIIRNPSSIGSVHYQGRDYLILHLSPYGKFWKDPKSVLFNLDTEKVEEKTPEFDAFLKQKEEASDLFRSAKTSTRVNDNDKEKGVEFAYYLRTKHHLDPRSLNATYALSWTDGKYDGPPQNLDQINFSHLYPDIAKKLAVPKQISKDRFQIVGREGMVDEEAWFNTLLHWFAPKGQELIDLYASHYNYDTDPVTEIYKTPISNYADIKAWLAEHPE